MSIIRADSLKDRSGAGAPSAPNGLNITGVCTATSFVGNGANLTGVGGGLQSQKVFTSNGTWTKPSGITKVKVFVTGGGGGGSGVGGNQYDDGGQGGAAGGTAIKIIDVSAISSVTVTVGAAGQASGTQAADGGDGGTSSFGSHCTATGGQGGRSATSNVAQAVPGLNNYVEDGKLTKIPNLLLFTPPGLPFLIPHVAKSFFGGKDKTEAPKGTAKDVKGDSGKKKEDKGLNQKKLVSYL